MNEGYDSTIPPKEFKSVEPKILHETELMPSGREFIYLTSMMAEASKLLGQEAKLYQVKKRKEDLYHDWKRQYEDPVQIGLIFENNPQPVLKKHRWLNENEEAYVAYLSFYDKKYQALKVEEGMLVEVITKFPVPESRIFRVSLVQSLTLNPLMWLCKLVPYREHIDLNPDSPVVEDRIQHVTSFNHSLVKPFKRIQ